MIEGRAVVDDLERVKARIISLGAKFKGDYAFKDIIFVPKKEDSNLSNDFVRVRVYSLTNWNQKNVVLVRKKAEFLDKVKTDKVLLKKEFDTAEEAFDFISKELPEFSKGFEFSRKGWEYYLDDAKIYLEDIKEWKFSVEIEAKSKDKIDELFSKIKVLERITVSMPEVMREVFGK